MLSTSQLRAQYAPACATKTSIYLAAYAALDAAFRVHNYAPRAEVTGAYNCRKITGGTDYSLHAYGPADYFTFWSGVKIRTSLAVDINWDKNPYGPRLVTDMPRPMIDAIYRIRTKSGQQVWRWGGYYTNNKDAMHFEIACSKADLATGIDPTTVPGYAAPAPTPPPEGDDDMRRIVRGDATPEWWITDGIDKDHIESVEIAAGLVYLGLAVWNNGDAFVVGQGWINSIPRRLTERDLPALLDAIENRAVAALDKRGASGSDQRDATILAAVRDVQAGTGPTAAEIAQAVNDDHARRMTA